MSSGHIYPAIIIGGGQSGLATAYHLRKAGVEFLILDDREHPGGSWQQVWPSMTLFSTAEFSNLPGKQMPAHPGFPPATHVVDYLREYEQRYEFPVQRPVRVTRVEHTGEHFRIHAPEQHWSARHVIAATGTWSAPFIPTYPGSFPGYQWHTATYPGAEHFAGTSVAVVGAANSAAQIAAELSSSTELTWYTREQPRWMPDDVDGRELFRRNRIRALEILRGRPDPGSAGELGDIVMLPTVRAARDSGALNPTPMVSTLTEISAEHLIWCTGFRPALRPFRPLLKGKDLNGDPAGIPGFHPVGYGDWTGPGSATLTGVGPFAKQVAQTVAVELSGS